MNKNKIDKLIDSANKDLIKWLSIANVNNLNEFYLKENEIKNQSFHKHNDVVKHINYIHKLENLRHQFV